MTPDLPLDRTAMAIRLKGEINSVLELDNCALITTLHILSYMERAESLSLSILLTIGQSRYESSARAWGYTRDSYPMIKIAMMIGSLTASRTRGLLNGQLSLCWNDGEKRIRASLSSRLPPSL